MRNESLHDWVQSIAAHTQPARIHYCDGSEVEHAALVREMCADGTLVPLHPELQPRSYLHRSNPNDVARTEHLTFISTQHASEVGPTNNWMSPAEANTRVWPLFQGCMKGRTMFVVPYLMGPVGSQFSRVGVELTDSPYVVANLRTMTRMGDVAMTALRTSNGFVRGIHSLGDLSPERRYIVHFPESATIWSIGSGYGGNALLSKKCHALRIASVQARKEGWLAEHMLIVGVTNPQGAKHYIAAAFPSACGKTNLAMLVPSLPGWTIETVGDDICWMHVGNDGRLWAINPEAGMFGVAPGTSVETNPNAMRALAHDTIFTNVALKADRTPWWEGQAALSQGEVLTDWRGEPWSAGAGGPAAHPNARFTVALGQCPSATGSFEDPRGVPISAIVFGGRRCDIVPLVYEARTWSNGVYLGASMVSETTAAATGAIGVPRHDPMAMLPFCGYNMGDYFQHWLRLGAKLRNPPKFFHVNWFRRDSSGTYLWPGFGENIRVLDWILRRVEGSADARTTPIGHVPTEDSLNLAGLELSPATLRSLLHVEPAAWLREANRTLDFLAKFTTRLPSGLLNEHQLLMARLTRALT
ncbi:MAG TPA: phosphoenolpyruvate carboxykinase (GTP) [Polyangiales bacterium]|nr:phosphoenolpyruvate carboxykinase (GTP) [Polyangiales bacterium]